MHVLLTPFTSIKVIIPNYGLEKGYSDCISIKQVINLEKPFCCKNSSKIPYKKVLLIIQLN
jgi:hypothetical protein